MANQEKEYSYGIEGHKAPELFSDIDWVDAKGKKMTPVQLSDLTGKFKVIYGFQSWCPGCHRDGFPALKQMVEALKGHEKVEFFVLQTVFEGSHENTKAKMLETQAIYDLAIPFGHDVGNAQTGNRSSTLVNFRTGGTPWFIFIDADNNVVFNDYRLNVEKAIEFLQEIR